MNLIQLDYQKKYILRAGNFFDSERGFMHDVIFLMDKGKVTGFLEKEQFALYCQDREGTEILDLSDYYVLTGFVDCHVHLALNGGNEDSFNKHLHALFKHGIFAVRDGGDRYCRTLEMRDYYARSAAAPCVVSTGCALRRKGKYGSFLGPDLESKDDFKRAIQELAARGVDQVKLLASGVVSFREYGCVGPMQFSFEELSYVICEACNAGLKVMVHANSADGVKKAVLAGAHSIEHGYFLDESCLDLMAEKGVYWIPTIVPVANAAKKMESCFTGEELSVIERTYRRQQEMVCYAMEKGVKVAVGTDSGAPGTDYGESYAEELLLFQQAGIDAAAIIRAATATGAQVLGLAGPVSAGLGTAGLHTESPGLTKGQPAPALFLAVKKNPLLDITIAAKPDIIVSWKL